MDDGKQLCAAIAMFLFVQAITSDVLVKFSDALDVIFKISPVY